MSTPALTTTSYAILGLLAVRPFTTYEIAKQMDRALWAHNHGLPPAELAAMIDVTVERAERIYRDIDTKRTTTRYLHRRPLLAGEVAEVRE